MKIGAKRAKNDGNRKLKCIKTKKEVINHFLLVVAAAGLNVFSCRYNARS